MAHQPPHDDFNTITAEKVEIPTAETFDDGDQIADFLRNGDVPLIAEFIDQNRSQFQSFFNRALKSEIDLEALIDALDSENSNIVRQCRKIIGQSLDRHTLYLDKLFYSTDAQATQLKQIAQELTNQKKMKEPLNPPTQRGEHRKESQNEAKTTKGFKALLVAASIAGYTLYDDAKGNNSPNDLNGAYSNAAVPIEHIIDTTVFSSENDDLNETIGLPSEPLQAYDTEKAFDSAGVDDLYIDTQGSIFYQDWDVPHNVYEANALTAQITGLDLSYTYAVQALESSFNPNSFNRIDACGLGQFVPSTLAEKAYRFAGLFGYEGIQDRLIERYVSKRDRENRPIFAYRFTSDQAELAMQNFCLDPHFNTRLIAYMQMEDIGRMQKNLAQFAPQKMDHYPITIVHAYTAHFAGRGAAQDMIENLHTNDGEAAAASFFSSAARGNATNQKLLYHPHTITNDNGKKIEVPNVKNPRTVKEFFKFLSEEKGLTPQVLDDYTDRKALVGNIIANVEALGIETTNVAFISAPLRSLRPQLPIKNNTPEHSTS